MLKKIEFNGNPFLGIFCKTNEHIAFIPSHLPKKIHHAIEKILNVKVVEISIGGGTIIGSLMCLNSHGAIVANYIGEEEREAIEKNIGQMTLLTDKLNAAGNNILTNDKGALVHPGIKNIKDIEDALNVPVYQGSIAGVETVGMAAISTNKGVLCHPKITSEEKTLLESVFDVPVSIGTVCHGMPYVGAGVVANTSGALTGTYTTGIELGRIEEALDLIP